MHMAIPPDLSQENFRVFSSVEKSKLPYSQLGLVISSFHQTIGKANPSQTVSMAFRASTGLPLPEMLPLKLDADCKEETLSWSKCLSLKSGETLVPGSEPTERWKERTTSAAQVSSDLDMCAWDVHPHTPKTQTLINK